MVKENIVWHEHKVSKEEKIDLKGHRPFIVWFTGLSGSGKSTLANAVEDLLYEKKLHTFILDGDNIRHGLNKDLGFSDGDRIENIRRIGEVAKLFVDSGTIVLTAFISPFVKERDMVRHMVSENEFIEVFVDTPIEVCEQRDPKGLYKKARQGEIKDFTGINSPYEAPKNPEIHLKADKKTIPELAYEVVDYFEKRGLI